MRFALRLTAASSLAAMAFFAWPPSVEACEVCYGAADAPVIEGMNMSIVFMLAVTYFVIGGMGATFLVLHIKARRRQENVDQGEQAS